MKISLLILLIGILGTVAMIEISGVPIPQAIACVIVGFIIGLIKIRISGE